MKTAPKIHIRIPMANIVCWLALIPSSIFAQTVVYHPVIATERGNQVGFYKNAALTKPVEMLVSGHPPKVDERNTFAISKRYSPIAVNYVNWYDAGRFRSVPVKIFWPTQVQEKCPVIVFSHGLGGSNEKCAYLGQAWAAQGFISVHIQHHGIDDQVWKRKIRPVKELRDVYERQWSGRTQANDIRFVLNQLDGLAAGETFFGQMLDMTRVGVAGYDLGGLAAMLVAGQQPPDGGQPLYDPRVKAIVVMSPPVADQMSFAPISYGTISTPALFFTGTDDDGVVGTTKAWQRRIPFDYMQGQDRFLITYQDAGHLIYSGHILPTRSRDDQKYQANVTQASTLFWRAYLKEEPAVSAYFRGQTLGGIVGTLGRIERRLGGNTDGNIGIHGQPDRYEQAIAPAPPTSVVRW
ncbi:MAG: hypothetical protein FWD31_13755 [Planctomycetaceae bacterium]|nr:hypothetical protein [Planctomycetaceae bacterium]